MLSQLFSGDTLLDKIARNRNRERISKTRHANDPAVLKVQTALLIWDPNALPVHGPDGKYGGETADAVFRFKAVELGVPEDEIVRDVGPRTVIRLDEIAAVDEARQASGFAVIAASNVTTDDLVNIRQVIEDTGGAIVLGLGNLAAVTTGGSETLDAVFQLVGNTVAGAVFPTFPELPVDR